MAEQNQCFDPPNPLKPLQNQGIYARNAPFVDMPDTGMNGSGDKVVTKPDSGSTARSRKKQGPYLKVKFGSAVVPIYRTIANERTRFTLSFYRYGRRERKTFSCLDEAKKEALFVAQRVQSGMQHVTDLKPHERDSYKAAEALLEKLGISLYSAVEDYVSARTLAGTQSLTVMATDYAKMCGSVLRRITVTELFPEFMARNEQDGVSRKYLSNLRALLTRFMEKFPGPILEVTGPDVDAWTRSIYTGASSRKGLLLVIKTFFAFAKEQNYLPADRRSVLELIKLPTVKSTEHTAIFTPEQMEKVLHNAPPSLVPIFAIAAFAGIRMAEIDRLDWSAIDLDRRIIELRAGQTKTASRRVIPISDNLYAWLAPLPRVGKVVLNATQHVDMSRLSRALGIEWPPNVLRHSFISYRIAIVQSADQVALEAGNSPSIIFKHYRELTTPDVAEKWFSILPKEGQWENTFSYSPVKRVGAINGVVFKLPRV